MGEISLREAEPSETSETSATDPLAEGAVGLISERMQDVVRDFQRLRAQFATASEPDSEWALNRLIVTLVREGPMRLMALAAAAQCDSSTVSRQVGTLVAKGYLERLPDPDDGRACLLKPTAAAHERYRKYLDVRAAREEEVLSSWSDADRARFAALLTRYSEDFRAYYVGQLGPSRRRNELPILSARAEADGGR
jgi:DNA-binding MarR family transcriptional regulator